MAAVLVTGGRGFLGRGLVARLLEDGELRSPAAGVAAGEKERWRAGKMVILDVNEPQPEHLLPGMEHVVGDLTDRDFMASLFAKETFHSVFHLAAVLSGQAELDFDSGMKVNVDGTRVLLDCCRQAGNRPTLVMTSSVAVFGSASASGRQCSSLSEDTPVLPRSSYGMEKAVCELLVMDASRRGFVDGRCVRLPTVVVRPGRPNSATSSFCSSIVREPLHKERAVCPMDPDLPLWVQSPAVVVQNLIHAHNVELGQASPIITLPGLTTTPKEMVDAMAKCGGDPSLVDWVRDEFLTRIVSSWPGQISTPTAISLGFKADSDILSIIKSYIQSLGL